MLNNLGRHKVDYHFADVGRVVADALERQGDSEEVNAGPHLGRILLGVRDNIAVDLAFQLVGLVVALAHPPRPRLTNARTASCTMAPDTRASEGKSNKVSGVCSNS